MESNEDPHLLPIRRRNWTHAEKLAIVHETHDSHVSVSMVARKHGIASSMLFRWRKMDRSGLLGKYSNLSGPDTVKELLLAREKITELQHALGALALEIHNCNQENKQLRKSIAQMYGKSEITRLFARQTRSQAGFERGWSPQKEAA